MDPAIIVAILALIGTVGNASVTYYVQNKSSDRKARQEAEAALARYRDPLVSAAFDLQSRLYNICRKDFFHKYGEGHPRHAEAVDSTLYLFGQYFAWSEILRRSIQFLDLRETDKTREVAAVQAKIVDLFADDSGALGPAFMIWRTEQRGIGEQMISNENGTPICLGYASFIEKRGGELHRWFDRLESDFDTLSQASNERLQRLHHELLELVRLLDVHGVRYGSQELRKA
jgi:hypothetical protein